jgi:hypothetical protein
MMQPLPPEDQLIREQKAEYKALPLMLYANFTKLLRESNVVTEIVVHHGEKEQKIKCSYVKNRSTWKKFLTSIGQPIEPCRLAGSVETLEVEFLRWLLTSFTKSYQTIETERDLAWLKQVVNFSVRSFIMENKYKAYIRQRPGAFASPEVALVMTIMMELRDLQTEVPRVIHHVVKDPELRKELLEQHFGKFEQMLQQIRFLLQEPLPPLPQLMSGAFEPKKEKDEEGEEKQSE